MKLRNMEKKIYELLGVNIFRKYILFNYEKLVKKIGNIEDSSYHIKKNTINEIENFKRLSKKNARLHILDLTVWFAVSCFVPVSIPWYGCLFMLIDSYSIMTQRYNHIRANELLTKHKELKKRREENKKIKIEQEAINSALNLSSQSKKAEKKEKIPSLSTETYYWEIFFKSSEKEESNFDVGFTKVLK